MSIMYESAGELGHIRRVMLSTPSYDRPHAAYTFAMANTREVLHSAGIGTHYILITGNPHIDDCRNEFMRQFLSSDCTDLIFIDADVSWLPEQLIELMDYDCDIVGGVYPYRREDKQHEMPVRLLGGKSPCDGLLEVEGLPTGFMRITRRVVETLAKTAASFPDKNGDLVPILFERTLEGDVRYGGDIAFCRKWRATGGQVFAAYDMSLTHAGTFTNSFGAYVRAFENSTLRHVCDKVRRGVETEEDISEALRYVDNKWGADHGVLSTAILLARKADGPIIEAGSGLTTIMMAAANPDQIVYCLEHHGVHLAKLQQMSAESGITNIGMCPCPMVDEWYDLSDLDLPEHFAFGFVDGPPRAWQSRMRFFDHFSPDVILIDDANDLVYSEQLQDIAGLRGEEINRIGGRAAIMCKPNLLAVA